MSTKDGKSSTDPVATAVATETAEDALSDAELEEELMEPPSTLAPEGPAVEYEDVDDIIGIAAEMKDAEEEQISVEDVVEIGRELGLDERHIESAVKEKERREKAAAEAARQEAREARQRKKKLLAAVALASGVLVLFLVIGLVGKSGLSADLATVEQKRAQVRSVLERKAEVEARYEGMSDLSRDAEAELAGALNRVSIETRRYDEAAAAYNADASGFPSSLWVSLFGLPEKLPLSNEIDEW